MPLLDISAIVGILRIPRVSKAKFTIASIQSEACEYSKRNPRASETKSPSTENEISEHQKEKSETPDEFPKRKFRDPRRISKTILFLMRPTNFQNEISDAPDEYQKRMPHWFSLAVIGKPLG